MGEPRETWLLEDAAGSRAGTCSSCRTGTTGTSGSWTSRCARAAAERARHGAAAARGEAGDRGRAPAADRVRLRRHAGEASPGRPGRPEGQTRSGGRWTPGPISAGTAGRPAGRGPSGVGRVFAGQLDRPDARGAPGPGGGDQPRAQDAPHDASHRGTRVGQRRGSRATDRRVQLHGMRAYTVTARARRHRRAGGLTEVEVGPERSGMGVPGADRGGQGAPRPPARAAAQAGHARSAGRQEPQVKHILTGNAETNAHMIAHQRRARLPGARPARRLLGAAGGGRVAQGTAQS